MVSIIILNYHVKKELFACLTSVYASQTKTKFEIIVVDNDEKATIHIDLKKKFPKVIYIKNENKGFGQGNNVGWKQAKGDYLFFLNPDTVIDKKCVDSLVWYLDEHKKVGIVAPLLYDMEKRLVPFQGARELTPKSAIFSFSFIHKLFPNNSVTRNYWLLDDWDKKSIHEVDSIPGTAFMIRQELYEKLNGFDEHFFLYFEEHDLCKRAKALGSKIVMNPQAKIQHAQGSSTKKLKKDVNKIFQESRFYYLKKHFGFLSAVLTESVLRTNKYSALLLLVFILGIFLRIFTINQSMPFIGDQAWFYLSARDMLLSGHLPLVGITSSHPWLHQGAFWTYLLAPVLWLARFNPVSGAYLSVIIGLCGLWGIYKLGSAMFSKNVGLIASVLFATSPLIVFSDRMPYHTSPIPLLIIFAIYCLYQWVQGKISYFPLLIIILATLYNFELATFLFSGIVLSIWFFGFLRRDSWAVRIFNKKILFLAVSGWIIVMMPMILYDVTHGFSQTFKFLLWIGYRVLIAFGYTPINPIAPVFFGDMVHFVTGSIQQVIFPYTGSVALAIFAAGILFLLSRITKQINEKAFALLGVVNLFLIVGLFIAKTPSGAYLPMVFPGIILLIALFFDGIISIREKGIWALGFIGLMCMVSINSYYVLQKSLIDESFSKRLEIAHSLVKGADGKEYNLIGRGLGSEFETYTMNYTYLTWWLGNEPVKAKRQTQFVIDETPQGMYVQKKGNK